jgi:pimeloyl-ACP methyl ester carboxylesterase
VEKLMSKLPRDMDQSVLHDWVTTDIRPLGKAPPVKAIVFIHGIISDHTRFERCQAELAKTKTDWRFFYVDYDYHAPLDDNGAHFSAALRTHFRDEDHVVVIAHSMGGLVARLACLRQQLPFVRAVFLLATPNNGAFRTSSLGILAEMTRAITGKIWGIRPRKVGIFDLTRVAAIMAPHLKDENVKWTEDIDYVSIPGRYFHAQRGVLDHSLADSWKVIFGGLDAGFELARAFLPLFSIKLDRAHDGIVEEASNSLLPEEAERKSEKNSSIRRYRNGAGRITYAHLRPDSAIELVHVQVPDNDFIINVIGDIIDAATLEAWHHNGFKKYQAVLLMYDRDYPVTQL